jgi:hypothetical protein
VAEPRRLDQSPSERRTQVLQLRQVARQLRDALASLHPRSRQAIWPTLYWMRESKEMIDRISRLPGALEVLQMACTYALDEIPSAGGPSRGRRDAVIRAICAWLDRLEPHRTRAGGLAKLGLIDKTRDLEVRRRESVKIVCRALHLPFEGGWARIIARALSKESAPNSR